MTKTDPEAMGKRLAEHYASLTEYELRRLADDAWSLTDVAKELLKTELSRRGLVVKLRDAATRADEQFQTLAKLRKFRDIPDALLAQSVLDSAEIECLLFDENVIRMNWLWSNLLGGIKLLVKGEDASAALELLDQKPIEMFDVTGIGEYRQPRCPRCDSLNVSFGDSGKRLSYATIAVGVPLPVSRGGWKCDSCGHEWHEFENSQQSGKPSPG
jgi:hypothetical protein